MEPIAIAVFDIDGVLRDVGGSYRRAIADTVEHYTQNAYRPTLEDIDRLKSEGIWNNDWKASEALIHRYFEQHGKPKPATTYEEIVDFFQKRYRGPNTEDPDQWTGYIANEPLLATPTYFSSLADAGVPYAFFSGATKGSANFILERRIGLASPVLVAMEDAPGKPNPAGLLMSVETIEQQLNIATQLPVVYAGDTAADMKTIVNAKEQFSERTWIAVGILPPHAQKEAAYQQSYAEKLRAAGAITVLENVQQMTGELVASFI